MIKMSIFSAPFDPRKRLSCLGGVSRPMMAMIIEEEIDS